MVLFLYFGVLLAVMAVLTGFLSWPWAAAVGIGVLIAERWLFRASHLSDATHALDEPGHHGQPHAP